VLDGGLGDVSGSTHGDAKLARGRHVDGGVGWAGAYQESKVGELLQYLLGGPGALAHGYQYVEAGEACDNLGGVSERLGEDLNVGVQ
jgi:hypothetical protein